MKYLWIDWSTKLPLKGGPGLLLVIGIIAITALGVPEAKLLLPFMALGAVVGSVIYWWRNR